MKTLVFTLAILFTFTLISCESDAIQDEDYGFEIKATDKGDLSGPGSDEDPIEQ